MGKRATNPWLKNDIQFPRLLAEIAAVGDLTPKQLADIAASMGLQETDVQELFDRAEAEWDTIKYTRPGMPRG